jgi:hypothetical protein
MSKSTLENQINWLDLCQKSTAFFPYSCAFLLQTTTETSKTGGFAHLTGQLLWFDENGKFNSIQQANFLRP